MTDSISTWRAADGDNTYALDWPIDENSLVWEIGGYEGRWAAQMVNKFDCGLEVFEPQRWAFEKLEMLFYKNHRVRVFPFGLLEHTDRLYMGGFGTDGASILKPRDTDELCDFHNIYDHLIFDDGQVEKEIDVCLMNIEGAEFSLIPYLTGSGLMKNFRFFWCQFHTFADPNADQAQVIYNGMNKTHNLIWDYYPTAVAWERRDITPNPSPKKRGEP